MIVVCRLVLLGSQIRAAPPPATVAAQVVSSVLSASTPQSTKCLGEGKDHDSSTDTEDSDDSEND